MSIRNTIRNLLHPFKTIDKIINANTNFLSEQITLQTRSILSRQLSEQVQQLSHTGISSHLIHGKKIIVSLTTFGKRINNVYLTIESIMRQTVKPNKIILWLANDEFSIDTIPQTLKTQQERGLDIRFCDDLLSYKKLIPTLLSYPNDTIITIDDDIIYPSNLLDTLITEHIKRPNEVICTRAREITFDQNNSILPYIEWPIVTQSNNSSSNLYVATGIGGILYPPHSLSSDVTNKELFLKEAPYADDLWFKIAAMKIGTNYRVVSNFFEFSNNFISTTDSNDNGLFQKNIWANDIQLKNIFKLFNISFSTFNYHKTSERLIPELYTSSIEEYNLFLKHKFVYELVAKYIKKTDKVLEIGCGTGYGTEILSKTGASIYAIDIDEETIKECQKHSVQTNIKFFAYDGKKINLPEKSFDIIISFQVIEHIRKDISYLRNIKKLLKPNGFFFISTPNRNYRLTKNQKPWNPFHIREYDSKSLSNVVTQIFPNTTIFSISSIKALSDIEKERVRSRRADYNPKEIRYIPKPKDFLTRFSTKDYFCSNTISENTLDLLATNLKDLQKQL